MENCVSSAALDAARTRLDAAEAARETILLHYYQGLGIAEIAQMLGLPELSLIHISEPTRPY